MVVTLTLDRITVASYADYNKDYHLHLRKLSIIHRFPDVPALYHTIL